MHSINTHKHTASYTKADQRQDRPSIFLLIILMIWDYQGFTTTHSSLSRRPLQSIVSSVNYLSVYLYTLSLLLSHNDIDWLPHTPSFDCPFQGRRVVVQCLLRQPSEMWGDN